jgi:hypothetical protein
LIFIKIYDIIFIENKKERKNVMNAQEKLALTKERYNKLKENPKNVKCGGVLRKLRRQLRNAEN